MAKILMKGNEAIGKAAIVAGCKCFFGYPITPQNEIPEYLSHALPKAGGSFVQAESEVAAINMLYGAAGTGTRCLTSSSSPGIALKQEGITYMAGAEVPGVIMNLMRGGPGLGGIQAAQSDYNMCVKGGGNGDYRVPSYAPASVQEAVDLTIDCFDLADHYRTPVMLLADGIIGQMMEPVSFDNITPRAERDKSSWATTGTKGQRKPNVINSLFLAAEDLEVHNHHLFKKYAEIEEKEQRAELYLCDDADMVFAAYGTTSRIVRNVVDQLREEGHKVGLFRPITLWPFPKKALSTLKPGRKILTVEMSMGQMVEDIKLYSECKHEISFFGRTGGVIPAPAEIYEKAKEILGGK
ncbi:MAG: 3-methyl-2-oxobutanoate dehydrogenase subunit VorB [Fusobacteriaceae bacterium]|nr:3-methyl-2-oxobutanoate dehydrogenase subunit VorB [Fusobacteriaceae bacterium]MBP9509618.1 3-methyl-2-oxobutanoate dehydrogenase subunit VorB [Fusobacteriaceae bacterium]